MIYFVFGSASCNLSCKYCGGTPEDLQMPERPQYDPKKLVERIAEDEDPVVVFYGGEPLLNIPFMQQVMDSLPKATFVLQSNCTLLHVLPTTYLKRFSCILASIDGRPETVAEYRGPAIYKRLVKNLLDAKARGFEGHIIARMACSLQTDIYEDVRHLLNHELKFDAVYWQLDAEWDFPMNIRWGDFEGYLANTYKPGIERLFEDFKQALRNGSFLNINPFAQPLHSMLIDTPCQLRCGAGHNAVSITTDGRYVCCPVASAEDWNNIGTLDNSPKESMNIVTIGGICDGCDIRQWCGGRCLYANQTMNWKEDGYKLVCSTVRQIMDLCQAFLPELKQLIADGKVDPAVFTNVPCERYSIETIP